MSMEVLPGNGLRSTLQDPVDPTDTILRLDASASDWWPLTGEYRAVICVDPINGPWELVKVTGGQGTDTLTVERAAEEYNGDDTAYDWPAGAQISAVLTEEGLEEWAKRWIRGTVWHTGNGPPPAPGAWPPDWRVGDLYLDVLTGNFYRL